MRTTEPTQITTREEVSWARTFDDYPASLWQLNYYFRGPGTGFNAAWATEVTADGDDFAIEIPGTKTDDMTLAGTYSWQAWVTEIADSTNKKMVDSGTVRVVLGFDPNAVTTVETRTKAKIMLDTLDAALLAAGSADMVEYEVTTPAGSTRVKRESRTAVLDQRKYWIGIVARENAMERVRRGQTFGQTVLARLSDD